MKINKTHLEILNLLRMKKALQNWEITGHSKVRGKALVELLNQKFVEPFRSKKGMYLDQGGVTSYSYNGFEMYRLTADGITVLIEDAIEKEERDLALRVADRVYGVDLTLLRKAGTKYETAFYSKVADEILKTIPQRLIGDR